MIHIISIITGICRRHATIDAVELEVLDLRRQVKNYQAENERLRRRCSTLAESVTRLIGDRQIVAVVRTRRASK